MSDELIEEVDMDAEEMAATSEEINEDVVDTVEAQLAAAQAEAAKNLDGWQRALADLANARKRFDKQSKMAYTNATAEVIGKLLPVIDDLDRAMVNVPEELVENSWFEGLSGIFRKLNNILEGIQVERIAAVGELFDPNCHEAIMQEDSDEHESGCVIRELQAGYRIGERVIRPALVVVAS